MSNNRTEREKRKRKKRQEEALRRERIHTLINEKEELEEKIQALIQKKFKQFHIRNFVATKNTAKFTAPFVLSCGITVSLFYLFAGGLPIVKDDIAKYKLYNLDYNSKAYVTTEEDYHTATVWDELKDNSLVVYSPWEEQNGEYIRTKREYQLDTLKTLDLYRAVLDEDYQYIEENLPKYKQEIQSSNHIRDDGENDYIIQASLHILDKNDHISVSESDLKNILITVIEAILSFSAGAIITHFRDYDFIDYKYEMRHVSDGYQATIKLINRKKEELKKVDHELAILTKKIGGNQS